MESAINELTTAIQNANNGFDWTSAISAVCSIVSLIAIVILLKERKEKQRPYLQISFELIKSSLVCLVIRNVGEVPAKLKGLKFNKEFVEQLPTQGRIHAQDKDNLNISIYPKQQWVLYLDVITPEVLKYKNTKLEITFSYSLKDKKRLYKETEAIEFNDYSGFLAYISEMDELTQQVKKLGETLTKVDKSLNELSKNNSPKMQTETYANISDSHSKNLYSVTFE